MQTRGSRGRPAAGGIWVIDDIEKSEKDIRRETSSGEGKEGRSLSWKGVLRTPEIRPWRNGLSKIGGVQRLSPHALKIGRGAAVFVTDVLECHPLQLRSAGWLDLET